MNGRPLEYVPVDPQDPIPLTPNHFLLLEANPTEPTDHFDPRDKLSSKGWRVFLVDSTRVSLCDSKFRSATIQFENHIASR
jgi:hypothetical protein